MTLAAHKFIDGLRGLSKKYRPIDVPGMTKEDLLKTADRIERAEKFDFGALMLEKLEEPGRYAYPTLTKDEMAIWREGLIPLPAPLCWYEFILSGNSLGLLLHEEGSSWHGERLDLQDRMILCDGVVATMSRVSHDLSITAGGNLTLLGLIKNSEAFMTANVGSILPLAQYLTLMLHSKTTEVTRPVMERDLNHTRIKKGLTPLQDHRIITIVPGKYRVERDEATGMERRSPRLHWRRTHLRHFADGRVIVIARMLVGRADLGEVSHEYRITELKETVVA